MKGRIEWDKGNIEKEVISDGPWGFTTSYKCDTMHIKASL
jgi:hypothetical protein